MVGKYIAVFCDYKFILVFLLIITLYNLKYYFNIINSFQVYSNVKIDALKNLFFSIENCSYDTPFKTSYVNYVNEQILTFDQIEENLYKNHSIKLEKGGKSYTHVNSECNSTLVDYKKVAIIVPYRNRDDNLKVFLNNMHVYLTKKKINYGIYLIEPIANITFNRGMLMNIGFVEAIKDMTWVDESNSVVTYWDCFIFHDVDMIPEDERVAYTCNNTYPVHLAVAVKKFGYSTGGYWNHYFGGICAFTREQYEKINGFSNLFFGWGSEDDDLYERTRFKLKNIIKLDPKIARYYTADHKSDSINSNRLRVISENRKRMYTEGLKEGLLTLNYEQRSVEKQTLFTRIYIYYNQTQIMEEFLQTETTIKYTDKYLPTPPVTSSSISSTLQVNTNQSETQTKTTEPTTTSEKKSTQTNFTNSTQNTTLSD